MSRSYQKPTKKQREEEKRFRKERLVAYRKVNAAKVIERDNSLCAICFFKHDRERMYADVHHVYSRAREAGNWREHYTNLMLVCRACHPLPVQTAGASVNLAWVEVVLEQANNNPINVQFEHS